MRIKKFTAETETAAIELAKGELGPEALVINIKTIKPRGLRKLFKKPVTEVTAAYDERGVKTAPKPETKTAAKIDPRAEVEPLKIGVISEGLGVMPGGGVKEAATKEEFFGSEFTTLMKDITISEQNIKIKDLENQLESKDETLRNVSRRLKEASLRGKGRGRYNAPVVRMFDDTLAENGVSEEIRSYILDEIDLLSDIGEIDINIIVKIVYNTIVSLLQVGDAPEPQRTDRTMAEPAVYAFVGGTGVGKTTTIAKIAAHYMMDRGLSVGLVTADTYRMAAVEQLKLYGEIFGVEVKVVYNPEDLGKHIDELRKVNDVILVDTAGRSPKSKEGVNDIKSLLDVAPNTEVFLALSLTAKSDDLMNIVETYAEAVTGGFRLIFTKWDETDTIGSILNVVYKTGRRVAYVTTGQNVPQDFEVLRPEAVARAIMGL